MASSDDSNSSQTPIPGNDAQPVAGAKTASLWFFTLFNLFILVAILASGIWYYLNIWQSATQQQLDALAKVDQQQSVVDNVRSNQSTLDKKIQDYVKANATVTNNIQIELEDSQNRVAVLEQQLAQTQLKLAELGGRRPADWLLAEADYLVRMAGRKLWLESDDRGAIMLLAAADARLADLNDPSLIPVRSLLAEDIQVLKQLNPISLTSVALSISGMLPQVNNLPIATLKLPELAEGEGIEPLSESVADWRENLKRSWHALVDDFISVKNRAKPIEPLMSAQSQWLVREQLSFALLQAKSAALQGQSTLYQQSLQRALAIIVEDFELTSVKVEQFSAALQNLQQTNIQRTFPQQLRAQQPLTDRLNERVNRLFSNGDDTL
jgi:uroporphyrin-3 C-methyltransferase